MSKSHFSAKAGQLHIMKFILTVLIAIVSCGFASSVLGEQKPPPAPVGSEYVSSKERILQELRPLLDRSGIVVRLYYETDCGASTEFPAIPLTKLQSPSGGSVLSAVRRIFEGNAGVFVDERANGIIVVRIGQAIAADAILRTRIPVLSLTPVEQYNPQFAIGGLERAKEMTAAVTAAGFHYPDVVGSFLIVEPSATAPHLPSTLRDVTADQVLDLIAKTFGGMIIYGFCSQNSSNHPLLIDFNGLHV